MKWCILALAAALPAGVSAQGVAERLNDYPTVARAEYVFACMAVNGETRRVLEQCSCSIDQIASVLPYEDYVEAETVLAMQQTSGERSTLFRDNAVVREAVAELRRAQAEADVLCF